MIAFELLNDSIPPLKGSDTGEKALAWMDEFRVSHLPVVKGKEYSGLISEEEILNLDEPDKPISKLKLSLPRPFILGERHVYDAVKVFADLHISVLPVLNSKEQYIGMLTSSELLSAISNITAVGSVGGIIVIELNTNDYALSQIARIVESNNARILSAYITPHSDSTKMELTLKIDHTDLARVIASLTRHNFTVTSSFHESVFREDMKFRYDALMHYLKF